MNLKKHPRLKKALDLFAKEFFSNPFKYIFEVDLQVLLSKNLEQEFSEPHLVKRKLTKNKSLEKIKEFNIGKIHREYPSYVRFDNVVLADYVRQMPDEKMKLAKFEFFYRQPIKYAIELKHIPINQYGVKNAEMAHNDYKRFVNYKIEKLKKWEIFQHFEYGLQLNVFQGLEEQEEFLVNHREKYADWNNKIKELQIENPLVEYCYLDVQDHQYKSIFEEF